MSIDMKCDVDKSLWPPSKRMGLPMRPMPDRQLIQPGLGKCILLVFDLDSHEDRLHIELLSIADIDGIYVLARELGESPFDEPDLP